LISEVYEASVSENWIRLKVYTDTDMFPSSKKEGLVKIIKNYDY